jgi:hypothetical protein
MTNASSERSNYTTLEKLCCRKVCVIISIGWNITGSVSKNKKQCNIGDVRILREAANNESICLLAVIQESILREVANKESICLLAAGNSESILR